MTDEWFGFFLLVLIGLFALSCGVPYAGWVLFIGLLGVVFA